MKDKEKAEIELARLKLQLQQMKRSMLTNCTRMMNRIQKIEQYINYGEEKKG